MDVSALLAPIGDDAPSGENLEYDEAFTEMELAAQPGEERQVGDSILPAEDPDFGEVAKLSLAVMGRSHDIRAAVFLAEAVLHTKGLVEFAKVTSYIRGCLEQHWATCHPELDEDDGDATMRINAVQGLADAARTLRALRRTALTDSRTFGKLSLRHVEVAEGQASPAPDMDDIPDANGVNAAFRDTDDEVLEALAAAAVSARDDVAAIEAVFGEHTPGEGPNLDPLAEALGKIQKALSTYAGAGDAPAESPAEAGDAAPAAGGAAAPAQGGGGGGAINTPQDVTNALERIIAYYQRSEPSSPVPVLLERAKRLVNADFLAIIEDMAKDGLEEVRRIGGIKSEDDY